MKELTVIKGDITTQKVDVIVNAANSSLMGGGGVDGAIHRKGGSDILKECMAIRQKQGKCKTGDAVYTSGGLLPCRYVIHTVGPIWDGGDENEEMLLASCYRKSLEIAEQLNLQSIAFPNISTGVYGYPKAEAAKVAIKTILEYAQTESSLKQILFVCFDDENYQLYKKELG